MLSLVLTVIWLVVAGWALLAGLDYYLLPLEERAFSELAPLFSPTGLVGLGFGVIGGAMIFIGVVGYMVRKRFSYLARLGPIKKWLQVHIFLCTLGPFLVLLHTTFKFGGIVSIAFWSMALVVLSGVFGRYVYVRIPKSADGRDLAEGTLRRRSGQLAHRIAEQTGVSLEEIERELSVVTPRGSPKSLAGALMAAARADLVRRVQVRRLRDFLERREVPERLLSPALALANERQHLDAQVLLMQPFQRMFRYWHVVHLPLAIVMLLVVTFHVGVAFMFGYTWIF